MVSSLQVSLRWEGRPRTWAAGGPTEEHDFLQWGFDLPNVTRQARDKCQVLCDSQFPQEMP